MKILYFTNEPSPYTTDLFNELAKNNKLTVIYGAKDIDKRDSRWNLYSSLNFEYFTISDFSFNKLKNIVNSGYDSYIIGYYACINAAFLMTYLKKKKLKFFLSVDGGFINNKENIVSKRIKTHFISMANWYFSSGNNTDSYLTYYGANSDSIIHIPFTSLKKEDILKSPISYKEKMILREKNGYSYKRLFISVGSFIERKGYDIFLKSIDTNDYYDCDFLIIGGGEQKEELQTIINDRNLSNVHLIDFCPKEKVFEYLKMSDVFFFPSKEDIWGLVINEAMACGLPVVSSDRVIAAKELIDKIYLYNIKDDGKLRKLLITFANMKTSDIKKIGADNLKKIKDYTIENYALKIVDSLRVNN